MTKNMMSMSGWIKQLDNVLEWSPVRKCNLLLSILLFIFLQYTAFHFYELWSPNPYVDYALLQSMTPIHLSLIASCVFLILSGRWLNQFDWAQVVLPYIYSAYYACTLLYLAHMTGIWSIAVGLVLAGAPLFGFILLASRVVYVVLSLACVVIVYLSFMTAFGHLPYAPLFRPTFFSDPAAKPFMLLCYTYFALPHFISMVAFSDLFLRHWRRREDMIHQISLTDSLTGLSNRRAITFYLQKYLLLCQVEHQPISVILVDLDHFKQINDNFGHLIGDEALRQASECMREVVRKKDQLGRYGGEEFLIVLVDTPLEEAAQIAERCRRSLEQTLLWSEHGVRIPMTASFGVYCSTIADESMDDVMRQTDHYLYQAKSSGRNRICHFGSI
jgi:diguanylate cyclase (GGDEF)-like protein